MRISPEELRRGYLAFQNGERRDAMYQTATFLVEHFWANPSKVADGLGVLLLVWNAAHYRYGSFDFDVLEKCIANNQGVLDDYRKRSIMSYTTQDDGTIGILFDAFREALKICEGKSKGKKTPVGVAKALHLLAPSFFPLWDKKIAKAYHCDYATYPLRKYLKFVKITKDMAGELHVRVNVPGRTLL
jgi:hypothetical protein